MSEIYLEVNGKRYKGWTNVKVSKSLENFAGQFSFSSTVKENASLVVQNDLKLQDEVAVYIDETKIMTGYIEDLNISYSATNHSISVAGRDKTGDLIDSSIRTLKSYNISDFIVLIKTILSDNGYNNIEVINVTGDTLTMEEEALGLSVEATQDETIAQFLQKYAKKVQVLLTTNEDGNIVVTRESESVLLGQLVNSATDRDWETEL